jgi:hypothetical protein
LSRNKGFTNIFRGQEDAAEIISNSNGLDEAKTTSCVLDVVTMTFQTQVTLLTTDSGHSISFKSIMPVKVTIPYFDE